MAVSFSSTKQLLATMATTLASQATDAGLSNLASGLTSLSSEISGQGPTEREFFGGGYSSYSFSGGGGGSGSGEDWDSAAMVWSNILQGAANIIMTQHHKDIKDDVETIKTQHISIATSTDLLKTYMLKVKELAEGTGIHTITPYTMFALIPLYQSLIEHTQIFNDGRDPFSDPARQAQAVQTYKDYVERMTSTLVNPWNIGTFDSPGDYPDAT